MSWLQVLFIAVGLSMDAFAVSIAAGMSLPKLTGRHIFRLSFHFGLFQFLMPVLGWGLGTYLAGWIERYDHWVAFGLLALVGGHMLWEVWKGHEDKLASDPTRGLLMVTLSIATSIDAFAVGLTMAFLGVVAWAPSLVIGLVTGSLVSLGICSGHRLGNRFGNLAQVVGGLVLIGLGVRILISHLLAG
jgi:putative Mn2+ efflux pump MntP